MTTLDQLTVDDFAPTLQEPYALDLDGQGTLDFTLLEARRLGDGLDGARDPFALVFRGPLDPQLEQRTYGIEHPRLGRLLFFIVPIAREADGMRYEAIFG